MQTIFDRLEKLRNVKNLTWEHLAEKLELSVSMLMMVRRGESQLSDKALHRLGEVEWSEGIVPPPVPHAFSSEQAEPIIAKRALQKKGIAKLRGQVHKLQAQITGITTTLDELEK